MGWNLGKTILITGASSGIGEACARKFVQEGNKLILLARRQDRLQKLQGELTALAKSQGISCSIVICVLDLNHREDVARVVHSNPDFQNINILINNAGLAKGVDPVQKASFEDWDLMIETNIKSLFFLTNLLLPSLVEQQKVGSSSHIINIGSVAGRWTYPGGAVYCATKAAVKAFSEGLRMDLHGTGIRVTNIEPGMVETEFSVVRTGDEDKAKKIYEGMKPLSAEDIAETIFWCASLPVHVNVQEMVVYPTDQAHVGMVHRRQQ